MHRGACAGRKFGDHVRSLDLNTPNREGSPFLEILDRSRDHLTRTLAMPNAKAYASTILANFERAQAELVGKAVILTDGTAGTVEKVWLDEFHGLRISIKGHDGTKPVSTIKLNQK
jgi:hypothetical protein